MNVPPEPSLPQAIRSFRNHPRLLRLEADVQPYAWGDTRFIPSLLGIPNPGQKPFAELWMGAHPDLPSRAIVGGQKIALDSLLEQAAEQILGQAAVEFADRLPYLLKILSAATPLSIQAHPTKRQAEEGFVRENATRVALSARERNYRDDNHKPEMISALTDLYALRGFRPLTEISEVLRTVPELRGVMPGFRAEPPDLKVLYERLMGLTQHDVDAILDPLIRRLDQTHRQSPFTRLDREYWVLRADREYSQRNHHDRGLFSVYLLNLLHLSPGQALFLPAGILHAYLEGAGVEIMANSNNVLRGGLTEKHVDVDELLRTVIFEGEEPQIVHAKQIGDTCEWIYPAPVREFQLRRIELDGTRPYISGMHHSADIMIVVEKADGPVTVADDHQTLVLDRGQVVLAPHGVNYSVEATGAATLYKGTVPNGRDVDP